MQRFEFEKLKLTGAILIRPFSADDARGETEKYYDYNVFLDADVAFHPTESLIIKSHPGVLRGLHYQKTNPQSRLIYCLQGEVFAVVVNYQSDSSDYGKYTSVRLSDCNRNALYVPKNMALGTLAMKSSLIACLCDGSFSSKDASGIRWNDDDLCIQWPLSELCVPMTISEKDRMLPLLEGDTHQR